MHVILTHVLVFHINIAKKTQTFSLYGEQNLECFSEVLSFTMRAVVQRRQKNLFCTWFANVHWIWLWVNMCRLIYHHISKIIHSKENWYLIFSLFFFYLFPSIFRTKFDMWYLWFYHSFVYYFFICVSTFDLGVKKGTNSSEIQQMKCWPYMRICHFYFLFVVNKMLPHENNNNARFLCIKFRMYIEIEGILFSIA